ncbi:MAG: response regulator [Deltaproteobacteria bacterium]|nr:response regulator [Deltaproteobacteria bacterium]
MPEKILVADDEDIVRELIQNILEEEGFEVVKARDGREAMALFKEAPFNIVITDLLLPQMNGEELVGSIKQIKANTDVIVVTGYSNVSMVVGVMKMGVTEFIRKPFQPTELVLAVKKVLEGQRLRSHNAKMQTGMIEMEKLSIIGTMAAGIAHEIKNPNVFIKGGLKIIKKYFDEVVPVLLSLSAGGTEKEALSRALSQYETKIGPAVLSAINGTERIAEIVKGMSTFEHNKARDVKETDTKALVKEALTLTSHRVKYHNLHYEVAGDLKKIKVNAQEMVVSFINFIVNAIDAIEERLKKEGREDKGNLRLTVRDNPDKPFQTIIFKDDGCGIDPKIINQIFDPFYTTKDVGKGTGLGLFLTKGNIERNGGSLNVKTAVGEGTEFTVELPHAG